MFFEEEVKVSQSTYPGLRDNENPVPASWVQVLRRSLELILVPVAIVLSLPVFALAALLVYLDSRGPVFFWQVRLGKDGKPFRMLKFRSMRLHSETSLEVSIPDNPVARLDYLQIQKLRQDPRLTRIGKILRRSSLDELPQLWNVLRGEMSLVGPRPILPEQQMLYGPEYDLYIHVKPGMTGLWQVSGRNRLSFADRASLDRLYIQNWTLWMDFTILLRTLCVVIIGDGAY